MGENKMNNQNTYEQEEFSVGKSPFVKNKLKNLIIKISNKLLKYAKLEEFKDLRLQ